VKELKTKRFEMRLAPSERAAWEDSARANGRTLTTEVKAALATWIASRLREAMEM
jgi:hypothetical protein